jgi:hypothetical protein
MIRAVTRNTNVSDRYDTAVLCTTMVACNGYKINNRICPDIPDTTFAVLWSKINQVIVSMLDQSTSYDILCNRSEQGYRSAMNMQSYQDSTILCHTSTQDLINRQVHIDSQGRSDTIGDVGTIVQHTRSTEYFVCITSALCSVMNIQQSPVTVSYKPLCTHEQVYDTVDVYTQTTMRLCVLCGITYCGTVLITLEHQQVLLSDEQLSKPLICFDKGYYLPMSARTQWQRFTRSISSSMTSPVNVVNRGCILVGSTHTDKCIYCVWFVRPTISYSTWSYISASGMIEPLYEVIKHMYTAWRPFTRKEIQLSISNVSHVPIVLVKGTMSSIYHDKVCIDPNQVSYCSSVSFACSTLRMQVITNTDATPFIRDVVCTQQIIQSLLPSEQTKHYSVTHKSSSVFLKMHTDDSHMNKGASITIGKNGGMQYLGRMNQVCESYLVLCNIMSRHMHTPEFIQHLSRSHEMMAHTFPEGISRAQPD